MHVLNFSLPAPAAALSIAATIFMATACSNPRKPVAIEAPPFEESEDYHADNDIAMTVRSIADAIRVGEPLDSTEYDFTGILTDGQGTPLYTDVQGSPGVWVVDIIDKKNASIRNLYLGDLLPGDLEAYLLQTLQISDSATYDYESDDAMLHDDTDVKVYDFNGGYLRFETRAGIAPNGLEGPLLTIILSANAPK